MLKTMHGVVASSAVISVPWDVSTAKYANKSTSVVAEDNNSRGVFFKPDGLTMYMIGFTNNSVFQYTLSTAWDVSTASYVNVSFSVASESTSPTDVTFKSDGTKMYIVDPIVDLIFQYTLSTAWDISTATYDSISFNVTAQETVIKGNIFSTDGTKMYIVGDTSATVFQYTISSAWDISTASYANKSLLISPESTNPSGIFFKPDGLSMYVSDAATNNVFQYTLTIAWDVSTASYANKSLSVTNQENNPTGLFFKSDGVSLYIIGNVTDKVYQYSL